MKPKYKEREWLKQKYEKEKLSCKKISEIAGTCRETIRRWMKKFNIPRRDNAGINANHLNLVPDLEEIIEGKLLGDGNLRTPRESKASAQFRCGDKHKNYIKWIDDLLKRFGVKKEGSKNRYRHYTLTGGVAFFYSSLFYRELIDLREKWYPNGEKKVPRKFKLTPTNLLFWYIGDGSRYLSNSKHNQKYSKQSQFYVAITAFDLENGVKQIIIPQLEELNIKCSFQNNNKVHIWKESHDTFFEYMLKSPYRPSCYSYKFPEKYRNEWGTD